VLYHIVHNHLMSSSFWRTAPSLFAPCISSILSVAEYGRVYRLLFFLLCLVTHISATVAPIRVQFCVMVLIPDVSSPVLGAVSQGSPKSKILAL